MAATGYLLTAFLIWALLTALGASGDEELNAPPRRLRRMRKGRTLARRSRPPAVRRGLVAAEFGAASAHTD